MKKKVTLSKLLNSGGYFCKLTTYDFAIRELIVSKMALKIDLISPDIYIVFDDELYFTYSSDLGTYGKFEEAYRFGIKDCWVSLYTIWDILEKNFGYSPELMYDVIKMYIFDMLIGNSDRHCANWGIITKDNKKRVAILDNEDSLNNHSISILTTSLSAKEYEDKILEVGFEEVNIEEIKRFITDSSEEFIKLFNDILDMLNVEEFVRIVNDIEKEEVIFAMEGNEPVKILEKEKLIEIYAERYDNIKQIFAEVIKRGRG